MEQINPSANMIDLFAQPAFLVKDRTVVHSNRAALQLQINPGTDISSLLLTGAEEYAAFRNGSLFLTVSTGGIHNNASVTRFGSEDVFLLDEDTLQKELHGLSLAAQELRQPLSTLMTLSDKLLPVQTAKNDSTLQSQIAQFNQGLYQMLRLIGNMSFAEKYSSKPTVFTETCNISAFFTELFLSAEALAAKAGRALQYSCSEKDILCLANKELLERATLNLISNAIKFSPEGSRIHAEVFRRKGTLFLTIENTKCGSDTISTQELFSSFLRPSGICDGRQGIGLGMVLVRSAASSHGGTVLIEQTNDSIKVTLTIKLRQSTGTEVRSKLLSVDYAGERDHKLIELADALPSSAFHQINS